MRPSEDYHRGLVRGILIGLWLFMRFVQEEIIRDNNQEQEQNNYQQRGKKRKPEENDDNCSWQGNFDLRKKYSIRLTDVRKSAEMKI